MRSIYTSGTNKGTSRLTTDWIIQTKIHFYSYNTSFNRIKMNILFFHYPNNNTLVVCEAEPANEKEKLRGV